MFSTLITWTLWITLWMMVTLRMQWRMNARMHYYVEIEMWKLSRSKNLLNICAKYVLIGSKWTEKIIISILHPFFFFFFLSQFSFTDDSQDSRGREGTIFYSTLPLLPAHEHWDIYLQLYMWDDYNGFLIATLVFTRLLLDELYHLIDLPFDWLIDDATFVYLLDELILRFCYSNLTWETGGFEFASTFALVL